MDLLVRCSGNTFCYRTKRCQRAVCSVLSANGLLPKQLSVSQARSCVSGPYIMRESIERRRMERRKLEIPEFVQQRLNKLQMEIVNSLLEQSPLGSMSHHSSSEDRGENSTKSSFSTNLERMAKYYFNQGGKLFRPKVSLLMANVCNQMAPVSVRTRNLTDNEHISLNQYRIAVVAEMMHTASLVHDDVIDKSDVRRGEPTVNALWGNKMAVLVGDFILARATQVLCSIGRANVISMMATIIEDLVRGEFMQMSTSATSDIDGRALFEQYMAKTYNKTASLFANSCKSVAVLSDAGEDAQQRAYEYGRHLGLAFQLVDDLLDFESSAEVLGKPTANDMKLGLATGPVLYAAQEYPELNPLISRRFSQQGDTETALEIIKNSKGLQRTRELARQHCYRAADQVCEMPNGNNASDMLVELALSQLDRNC
ncbi:hypothetical protein L596_009732 [Steinernema carpocapsae]|uniref:Polyprenyl synthetase n=1 Tax=Steinernema carpocapsae TaxID=34508 RepID=A0A4U5PGF7_STECR|nr:hypothetical protein L596_009732 [Steinernema carpocapsae]